MNKIIINDALEFVRNTFNDDYSGHDYFHTLRVYKMATRIATALKDQFSFQNLAGGIYTEKGLSRLFAVCIRHADIDGLRILPKGKYLCASCTEENRKSTLDKLIDKAKTEYGLNPQFTVQLIVVSGILHWNYEVQIYIK